MKKGFLSCLVFIFFSALTVQAQDVDVPGNLTMVDSTATAGNILKGGFRFIHNFGPGGNTFIGRDAGNFTMTGGNNTGSGAGALANNITGGFDTASGVGALVSNTNGFNNTASGAFALGSNTTGGNNTASGVDALRSNNGNSNTANGFQALFSNTTGEFNTAGGNGALHENTTGGSNTASGGSALTSNTTGGGNTASGSLALGSNTTGSNNTAIGAGADVSVGDLTNATAIGAGAIVDDSNKIRLGNGDVMVIEGQVPYTFTSDKNKKENFHLVDGEAVLRKIGGLSLTSWNYIGHDPKQFRHYGPVAQEFFGAFGHDAIGTIGTSTTINSGDMEGILMVAVQALEKRTGEFRQENEALKVENAELKTRLEAIERRLSGNANH